MITILGCSITGMMTALALAERGIKTSIIERSTSEKFPEDVRTTAFTRRSKSILEKARIWHLLEEEAGTMRDIYVVDNKSPRILHLDSPDGEVKGYIIPNIFIKETLYKAVKSNALIKLHKGVEYGVPYNERDKVVIPNTECNIETDLLLVCEGRNNIMKDMFKLKVDKTYGQGAIVLVCEHEKEHEGTALEHYMTNGPFASLPMKYPHHSSIVWCEKMEVAQLLSKMTIEELEMHLQEKMGEFLGKVKIISKAQIFPLSARLVKKYFEGNIVLVGDAAHSIHPLIGQGLNQGIKDIEAITDIISSRLKNGLEIDQLALAEYQKKRKTDNYLMYLITDNLNRVFSNDILPLSISRKFWLSVFNEFPYIKKKIDSFGSG